MVTTPSLVVLRSTNYKLLPTFLKLTLVNYRNPGPKNVPMMRLSCHLCHRTFIDEDSKLRHFKLIQCKIYTCKYKCGAKFSDLSSQTTHEKGHSKDKDLYTCTVCKKQFQFKSTLSIHETTNSDAKPFGCSKCNHTYKKKNERDRHELYCGLPHTHTCDYAN